MMNAQSIAAPVAYARFAGICYLAIFILAIYANFTIFIPLIETGDPAASAANIAENESRFRLGAALFLMVLILDLLIVWSLYLLLKAVDPHLALLSALFHLVYTAAHIPDISKLVSALDIISAPESYATLAAPLQHALAYHSLTGHQTGFTLTLIFFGIHLLVMGYLILRAAFLPGLIGLFVMIAGAGYIIDGFGTVLFADYDGVADLEMYIVILPALIGEGGLMLWLLIRGVNKEKWCEQNTRRS